MGSHLAGWWPLATIAATLALAVLVVAHPGPLPGEVWYIQRLQALPQPVPDMADFVRNTTGTRASFLAGAPLAVWLVWRWRIRGVLAVAIAVAAMIIVQPGMKNIVDRPRPIDDSVEVRAHWTSESFPSGHSLGTTAVWGLAAGLAWRQRLLWLAAALALPIVATGLSSGVQGVHWPSDAIGGTLVGAIAAWLMLQMLPGEAGARTPPYDPAA